jgi:putative (di)nucleoside polyphosphate hydrolase
MTLPYRPNVGVMLINTAGLIFAGQRIDTADAWQMPQGGIDDGEKPKVAALRELLEETGVAPDLVEFIAKTDDWVIYDFPPEVQPKVAGGKFKGQRQKWFLYRFKGTDDQVNIATDHPEFARWQWMQADALIASIVPFKRHVYEQVVAAFRPHLS